MLFLTLLMLASAKEPAYAKPEMVIEAAELLKSSNKFLVFDVRGKKAYTAGHVVGAHSVDITAWSKAFNTADRESWVAMLGAHGLNVDQPVVVYGLPKTVDPFRAWWILRYWGVKDVRVLNGGWDAFIKAGGKPDTRGAAPTKTTKPALEAQSARRATKDQILAGLKVGDWDMLLDVRTKAEHCGDAKTAKRNGSIPGAKHLPWTETLTKDGRLKPAPEMAKLFKDAGIALDKPATTYCQSGGRAAVMAFVYELMSGKPARNYYRSWAEWGNDEKTPIVIPKKPMP